MKLREAILTSVNSHNGMQGVELALHVMGLCNPLQFTEDEYRRTLEGLVRSGEIVELEYILPQMDYRIKSMYFPKGTQLGAKIGNWSADRVSGF